jgi:hypothetical protein
VREEQLIRAARRKVRQVDRLSGLTPICVYCGETAIECLELHHVTGRKLDADFVEVRCRNCHRKIELQRDVANLTDNGERKSQIPQNNEIMRLRLLGLAEGHVSTAAALRRWAEQISTGEDADEKEQQ